MNIAARALAQGSLTWVWWPLSQWQISLRTAGVILLMMAVLSSALSVVYIKALQRNLYSTLQASEQQRDTLQTQWSQLLLEENTWAAPERVQVLAQQTLGMQIPQAKDTVLLTKPA